MKVVAALLLPVAACGGAELALHAPQLATSAARSEAAEIDFAPMTARRGAVVLKMETGESIAPQPDPAAVLTDAIRGELRARALRGGDPGGYAVQCSLDRFAVRSEKKLAGAGRFAALYADATCEADRASDRVTVWRGVLRGRAAAVGTTSPLAPALPLVQALVDAMVSDAAREMASDLAVRVLALTARPSSRVFADEAARASLAGIDDGPLGGAALAEEATPEVAKAKGDEAPATRAAAWNAVAMAADAIAMESIAFDEDERVRFYQYKLLARVGTPAALDQLRDAAARDGDSLLVELANDAIASRGIGLPRRAKASIVTNGATTSP
jgi:hypothetical protein